MKDHRLLQSSSFGSGMKVVFDSPLGKALHNLPKLLSTQESIFIGHQVPLIKKRAGGGDFGTLAKPKVAALLAATVPSPFGRGEETVFDESVRRGKELAAETITVSLTNEFSYHIKRNIKAYLFPRAKSVSLRFYKLALYEAGGHFDFHRDTTHAPNHHATLLVEVKSAHKGGALVFEADTDGEEVQGIDFSVSDEQHIEWIAFYTDVRHKVEPVTEGVRIVLQYDVLVEQEASTSDEEEKGGEYEEEPYLSYTRAVDDSALTNEAQLIQLLSTLEGAFEEMENATSQAEMGVEDETKERAKLPKTLALPLFYLYRTESVLPEFLKSIDRELFFALLEKGLYEIALSPVVLESESDDFMNRVDVMFPRDRYRAGLADPVAKVYTGLDEYGHTMEVSVGDDHVFNTEVAQYIVSKRESCLEIEERDYIEYLGNEPVPAMYKYFLGVILVNKKKQ